MNKQFTGIIPPVITCFGKDGKFDEAAQREVVRFQARHVDGFYPCGTYGSVLGSGIKYRTNAMPNENIAR